MRGIKHLIKCRCILPTLKNRKNPPIHQFVVFSIVDNKDVVIEKNATCNNCGILHRIIDICNSEITSGAEGTTTSLTIEDISLMLPESVKMILSTYERGLPDYEYVLFMIDHEAIDDFIILTSDMIEEKKEGKVLRYKGSGKFAIEPFISSEVLGGN